MTQDQENITKAFQTSEFLVDEVREVYTKSENELLQIMALELLGDAVKINVKLKAISKAVCK